MRQSLVFDDFSGGLDFSLDSHRLEKGYLPWAENFRITSDGSLTELLSGTQKDLGSGIAGHDLAYFENASGSVKQIIVASATKWQRMSADSAYVSNAGTVTDMRTSMSSNTDTTFVVYDNKLYGLDPANNIGVWDGSTLNTYAPGVNTGPPQGLILGVWADRMWVAKSDGAGGVGMRIEYSEPADITNGFVNATGLWPTDNYTTLVGSGISEHIVGGFPTPDGLCVFTTDNVFLIYDSDSAAYSLVHQGEGCKHRRALAFDGGMCYGINERGIFRTNGRGPLEYVSGRIQSFFDKIGMRPACKPAGVIYDGSYWVTFDPNNNDASAHNRWCFEVNLRTGSIMQHRSQPTYAIDYLLLPARGTHRPNLIIIDAYSSGRYLYDVDYTTTTIGFVALPGVNFDTIARLRKVELIGRANNSATVYAAADRHNFTASGMTSIGAVEQIVAWDRNTWSASQPSDMGRARFGGVNGRDFTIGMKMSSTGGVTDRPQPYFSTPDSNYVGAGLSRVELLFDVTNKRR